GGLDVGAGQVRCLLQRGLLGLGGSFLLLALQLRSGDEILPAEEDDDRKGDRDDEIVAVGTVHAFALPVISAPCRGPPSPCRRAAPARAGFAARPAASIPSTMSATSRSNGRRSASPRPIRT